MMGKEAFLTALKTAIGKLRQAGSEITLVHHNDSDGLASASIMQVALSRAGFTVQRIPLERVHPPIVDRIHQRFDSAILYVDLGGRAAPVISEANDGRRFTIILDHHDPEKATDPKVVNLSTEFYGLSGELDISAATAAYLFALTLDEGNRDLAYLAVVGAVGDEQDRNGSLVGENRHALKEAVAQGQVRVKEIGGREQYTLARFADPISLSEFARTITTLGAAGYYMGGPALGIRVCMEGSFPEAERKLKTLNQIKQAAYEKVLARLRQEGFRESPYTQWFHVGEEFAPMGVKIIGEFCDEIRYADFVNPEKYIVGFQAMDQEIPGLGSFDWSLVKASMRVPSPLEKKITTDHTMPGLAYLVPEAAKQVNGSIDACHDHSAATLISVGREANLIAAMDKLVAANKAGI
jgi:single-stranded DNA-specific DHH superfamily exonuclease